MGCITALKMTYYMHKTENRPSWILRAFMSRLFSAKDNCFNCCGWKEAVVVYFQNLESFSCYELYLSANITKEPYPFYQAPDMLKTLIHRGFYKLLK